MLVFAARHSLDERKKNGKLNKTLLSTKSKTFCRTSKDNHWPHVAWYLVSMVHKISNLIYTLKSQFKVNHQFMRTEHWRLKWIQTSKYQTLLRNQSAINAWNQLFNQIFYFHLIGFKFVMKEQKLTLFFWMSNEVRKEPQVKFYRKKSFLPHL